jgi:hypothetical protein
MTNKAQKIPRTSAQAKKRYDKQLTIEHSTTEKKKWVMVKQRGRWRFAEAENTRLRGPHTVCYYDPNTGFYSNCHTN